jgi:hypothetical protein
MIRLALTETLLLAAIGGAAGLLLAYVGTRGILLLAFRGSTYVPIAASPSLPVLGFAFLLSAITGLIFGVAPAWINTHAEPSASLRGSGRSTASHSSKPKKALVACRIEFFSMDPAANIAVLPGKWFGCCRVCVDVAHKLAS